MRKHKNSNYPNFLYPILGDDFQKDGQIVVVEVDEDEVDSFVEAETEDEAFELVNELHFYELGSVEFGDWEDLGGLLDIDEVKGVKKVYFDCDDYKETTFAVLLYDSGGNFITIFSD